MAIDQDIIKKLMKNQINFIKMVVGPNPDERMREVFKTAENTIISNFHFYFAGLNQEIPEEWKDNTKDSKEKKR